MKKIIITLAVAATLAFSSCSKTVIQPVAATSNPVGSKVGEASAFFFLGWINFDADLSIKTAAANGGITNISTVDVKTVAGFLGTEISCVITGE